MSDERPYRGEQLSHALLQRRQQEVALRHRRAVGKVEDLLGTQRRTASELGAGLQTLARSRTELDRLEPTASTGLLASLVRPFTIRRALVARRSIAEGLLRQYEQVNVRLREATAFSDELKLTALELQQEVDRLHRERADALHNERLAATRVLELEAALREAEADAAQAPDERERRSDRFTFDLRTESVALSLFQAAAELCRQHLGPARSLRDTVLRLHEEMAQYVLTATHTVNAAGRRIQGLGMLADAPLVVAELQQSLDALDQALQATAGYAERSQALVAEVLPELSARLRAATEATEQALALELGEVDRERARMEAERALRREAEHEIERLLGDE